MIPTASRTNARTSRSRIREAVVEAEPDTAERGDPHVGAVILELLAESGDRHVERLGRAEPVLVPHVVHETLPSDDAAAVASEMREQVELLRAQLHLALARERSPGVRVDEERPRGTGLRVVCTARREGGGRAATQQRAQAREQ